MWEVTRKDGNQFYGVKNSVEYRLDLSNIFTKVKKGYKVDGYLAGGAVIVEKVISQL